MTTYVVKPDGPLSGVLYLPGDKSISHRAVILGSIACGRTEINGLLEAGDVQATIKAFREMSVSISRLGKNSYEIIGIPEKINNVGKQNTISIGIPMKSLGNPHESNEILRNS